MPPSSNKRAREDAPDDRELKKVRKKKKKKAKSESSNEDINAWRHHEVPPAPPARDPRCDFYRIEVKCGGKNKKKSWRAYGDEGVLCAYLSGATSYIVNIKSDWGGQSYWNKYRVEFQQREQENIEAGAEGFGTRRQIRVMGPPSQSTEIAPEDDHQHIATSHQHAISMLPTVDN